MAPGLCASKRRNFWLEFEESNPKGLRSAHFPRVSTRQIEGSFEPFSETEPGLVLAERLRFSSGAFSVQFRSVLLVFSGRNEPWRRRSHPAEGTPAHPGLQAQGSRDSEGDRGRWTSREKAKERVRGSPGHRAPCVHPLGACAPFLAPRAPPKVAVPSRFAQASGY